MRSLLDNKIHFALGSDGPINPFPNLMFATIHPGNPREALTLEDALIAYTAGSAFAESRKAKRE
jgi:predicted amidohydrolase YtcJ